MIHFEPANRGDIESVLPLMRAYYEHDHLPWDEQRVRTAVERLIREPIMGRFLVIRKNEELIGYMALGYGYTLEAGGRDGFIDELYLRPEFRGGGYGKAAVEEGVRVARADGIKLLRLEVTRTNSALISYYSSLGFEDNGRTLMTRSLK